MAHPAHAANRAPDLTALRDATARAADILTAQGRRSAAVAAAWATLTGDADLMPVAGCETAFTAAQAGLIAQTATTYGVPVIVAMLPTGCDPAQYTADPRRSLNAFRQSDAVPLLTVQVERVIAAQGDHLQWVEGRIAAARSIAGNLATYPPEHAATTQIPWIAAALDIAPATFADELTAVLADAQSLPHAGTRGGTLLRSARALERPSHGLRREPGIGSGGVTVGR